MYTPGQVQPKYFNNAGQLQARAIVTPDDHWDNYWREGPQRTARLGRALPGSGHGAKSMGQELANSDAFAQCQVEKVFRNVCLRPPGDAAGPRAQSRR